MCCPFCAAHSRVTNSFVAQSLAAKWGQDSATSRVLSDLNDSQRQASCKGSGSTRFQKESTTQVGVYPLGYQQLPLGTRNFPTRCDVACVMSPGVSGTDVAGLHAGPVAGTGGRGPEWSRARRECGASFGNSMVQAFPDDTSFMTRPQHAHR